MTDIAADIVHENVDRPEFFRFSEDARRSRLVEQIGANKDRIVRSPLLCRLDQLRARFLIAPGTDLLWHTAPVLDDRIEGQRDLVTLRDRTVLLPANQRYHPKAESLNWRQTRLRKT